MIFPICLSVKKYIGILGKSVCVGGRGGLIFHNELIIILGTYHTKIKESHIVLYILYFNPISGTCVMNPVFKRQVLQGMYMFLTGLIYIIEWDTLNVSTL